MPEVSEWCKDDYRDRALMIIILRSSPGIVQRKVLFKPESPGGHLGKGSEICLPVRVTWGALKKHQCQAPLDFLNHNTSGQDLAIRLVCWFLFFQVILLCILF